MGIRSPQGLSSGIGAHLGLARKLRLLLGMTRNQGPSQGPSATASRSATREDGLRGHNWRSRLPQTSLPGQDRQDLILLKLFLRTGQDIKHVSGDMARHSWPWYVDWIHGNVLWAWVSGGRRAWVSRGRQRRFPCERQAWVSRGRQRRFSCERRAWGSRGRRRAWVSRGWRRWYPRSQRDRGSRGRRLERAAARELDFGAADAGLAAFAVIPPNSYVLSAGLGGMTRINLLKTWNKNKLEQTKKTLKTRM